MHITKRQIDTTDRRRLLIIDDDLDWTEVLQVYFLDKYDVVVVNSAEDALERIHFVQPDALILDLVMPAMDGFGVLRRLSDAGRAPIPTILLTGWMTTQVEQCAAAFGCVTVLAKPVELPILGQVVSAIVRSKEAKLARVT